MAEQYTRSAVHRCQGMFLAAAEEVALVEIASLRCFERVCGRETRPSLRLTVC